MPGGDKSEAVERAEVVLDSATSVPDPGTLKKLPVGPVQAVKAFVVKLLIRLKLKRVGPTEREVMILTINKLIESDLMLNRGCADLEARLRTVELRLGIKVKPNRIVMPGR